ncbi:MAG: LysR family transcriptional regulator [Byssovorax sp.]
MEWLNYHHLLYFWTIVHEGSLTKAAARLRLTHSTLSVQVRALEEFLGGPLFERRGRSLIPTPLGIEVAAYADDIFRTGAELVDMARGRVAPRRAVLRVGVVSTIPKTVSYRLLEPALAVEGFGPVSIRQDNFERLLEDLATSRIHLVLSDAPPPEGLKLRVYAHLLGETDVLFYGAGVLAKRYRKGFPGSLEGAPVLLPSPGTSLRRLLDPWFVQQRVRVNVEGEFDDAGTMRAFGVHGRGLFPVRAALKAELDELPAVQLVGHVEGVRERYYAISVERRVRHPAMAALIENARVKLNEIG